MSDGELEARAVIARLGVGLDTLRRADYEKIAQACRRTPGPCFCGCHITEMNDGFADAEPEAELFERLSVEAQAYAAWAREAQEHVGAVIPWSEVPLGLQRAWTIALDKAHELAIAQPAEDIIRHHMANALVENLVLLGMVEMARLTGLISDDRSIELRDEVKRRPRG